MDSVSLWFSLLLDQPHTMPGLNTFPGSDDITRLTLPNGIVVLARPNFNSLSVVVSGYFPAGSLFDSDERLGLADFTAQALMRGTQQRSFQQLYDALESAGASLGIQGGTHSAGFAGQALAEDLGLLLSLLSETLRQPAFPQDQVERLRARLLTGLAIRAQNTADMSAMVLDQLLYPGHPYSRPEDGYPETIQAITQADLQAFHVRHYGPRGLVLSVVGAVEPQQVVDLVNQALGDWQNPAQPALPVLPPVQPLIEGVRRHVEIPGKMQTDIVMGVPGPARKTPEFLAASLGNSILGQFGMYGRIGQVVREQAGLAYYAASSLSGGPGPGPWFVSAGVEPGKVEQALELIRAEIGRFVSQPVTEEELADNQANYIGRLPLSLESNLGVAAALLNLERYDLGLDYYRLYPSLVSAITREAILEAARRYLDPLRLAVATAGSSAQDAD
ncbi:MAG TPA: pitrilysin family protein [Anaerolineales bacterium]|nr:pitrilysin family protein [Anaerolineales bacterium]